MQGLGWSVTGIEVDPVAAGFARAAGLDVHECSIENHPLQPGSFDAITFSHVLEHLHDPVGAIAECAKLLRPGGVLWLAVPNLDGAGRRFMTKDWAPLDPPRHLVMFTPSGIRSILSGAGFTDIQDAPTVLDAGVWTIRASLDMQGGGNGLGRPRLSIALRAVAARCDLNALRNRNARELLNVTATRGPTDTNGENSS
jgi:SAM-dependent methyltransferase